MDHVDDGLLAAHDAQLRTSAPSAERVTRLGPLHLVTFPWGRGWITYRDLAGADAATIRSWVGAALDHYLADPAISRVEWKARGHDHAPGLDWALADHGFEPGGPESVMAGESRALAVDVALPGGVEVARVHAEDDVRRLAEQQQEVFGDVDPDEMTAALLRRQAVDPTMELWVARVDGHLVCTGRLEPVPDSDFAGIWGGATVTAWRRKGIYRALTAARARSALRAGRPLLYSESTPDSRPILERAGFTCITTTTPWTWARPTP